MVRCAKANLNGFHSVASIAAGVILLSAATLKVADLVAGNPLRTEDESLFLWGLVAAEVAIAAGLLRQWCEDFDVLPMRDRPETRNGVLRRTRTRSHSH